MVLIFVRYLPSAMNTVAHMYLYIGMFTRLCTTAYRIMHVFQDHYIRWKPSVWRNAFISRSLDVIISSAIM